MIAALYVIHGGVYFGIDGVDPWDQSRDARLYEGPFPVVAHPPCARWGRYWFGGPTWIARGQPRKELGADDGCFASALAAVRNWGGVLEHPEGSHAWRAFGLNAPPRAGGWVCADFQGGWTCCVEQGHYGHPARKATWLYVHGVTPPILRWGKSSSDRRIDLGARSTAERRRIIKTGRCQQLSARQRASTPVPFRDLLLSIARERSEQWERG